MRTFSFRAAALALVATLAVAAGAYAADPPAATEQHHQRGENYLQQKLGLTDDQMQQIRTIRSRDFAAQRQSSQALRQAQTDLRRLALAGTDDAAIAAKQAQVQTLMTQSVTARVAGLKQIGSILTPGQREAFAALMDHGPRGHRHMRPSQPQGS
jgi:Spy/CpxP family protein refolding chaperone